MELYIGCVAVYYYLNTKTDPNATSLLGWINKLKRCFCCHRCVPDDDNSIQDPDATSPLGWIDSQYPTTTRHWPIGKNILS
uniref:Uncharacterized protein n=1 Tax=Acrobeloides nanus TaxID=290746 RepID=A0A914DPA0_9BILA